MIHIERIVNRIFKSNTFVISCDGSNDIWLVDVGDTGKVLDILHNNSVVRGVFLTHTHFDHLYGINLLYDKFQDLEVYVSEAGIGALYSAKKNLSKYHESPLEYKGSKVIPLHDGQAVCLYTGVRLLAISVPGHTTDSMAFLVDDQYLFTGDAYIPTSNVVSKLPGGNKQMASESRGKLIELSRGKVLLPGHGD
ncbi:MAG: MBL fold metallo-hydrolase [Bacteroidales bacterium]|nr:MBL fold metallo-hydrolase [Bacteroidales bacterium]